MECGFNDYEEMEVLGAVMGALYISTDYLKSIGKALAKVQDITVKLGLISLSLYLARSRMEMLSFSISSL